MIFDAETRLWLAFAATAFALMGLSLSAGAEGHAASAAQWPGARPGDVSRLALAYRAVGAGFVALGLGLAGATRFGLPAALSGLARPIHLDGPRRLAAGLLLAGLGAGFAVHRLTLVAPRLPGGLASEGLLGQGPPLRRRLAVGAAWLLSAEFFLFGCFLLSRRGGTP